MTHSTTAYGKIVIATIAATIVAGLLATFAVDASAQTSDGYRLVNKAVWDVQFAPVPSVLRLHVADLPSHGGMLVQSIPPGSQASRLGLHVGDILLEVNGNPVNSPADLPSLNPNTRAVSLHRGEVRRLHMPFPCFYPMPADVSRRGGVSASSFAVGNESIAVRSIGDQQEIAIATPALKDTMLRVQGTRSHLQQQILDAGLSPETTRRAFRAMDGVR
tara:strand:- start:224837 stop:225490 length:654 start_codon:yes stop_codon:yes gene_type:complete